MILRPILESTNFVGGFIERYASSIAQCLEPSVLQQGMAVTHGLSLLEQLEQWVGQSLFIWRAKASIWF